jgi:hypothetical protein
MRQVDPWTGALILGAISQVVSSPDFVQFSLDELQELKETSTKDFNTLDFSDYTVDVIDVLFPKQSPTRGQLDPLASYRTSPKRLREWRRLTTKSQQYLMDKERETQRKPSTDSVPTKTGRAIRTGSQRNSYASTARTQPTPSPANPLRQDADRSLRKQQHESKKKTNMVSSLVA